MLCLEYNLTDKELQPFSKVVWELAKKSKEEIPSIHEYKELVIKKSGIEYSDYVIKYFLQAYVFSSKGSIYEDIIYRILNHENNSFLKVQSPKDI